MIDPLSEELIPLREAADVFPRRRRGRKPHVATLYRYARHGYHGVKLEVVRAAGQLATSREAVARFIQELTELDPAIVESLDARIARPRSAREQARRDVAAALDAEGLC